MIKNKNIIVIAGPTATGKTATSLKVAESINAEIVNFDSLLFYKELNIGTAKPTKTEQGQIPHHLIDTHSISSAINAADYSKIALPIVDDIHKRGKNVVLVGGSGFYLQALLHGMYESQTTTKEILAKSEKLFKLEGITPFIAILKEHDKVSFNKYHENDHYRIRRAVEHFWMTNSPFSRAREEMHERKKVSPYRRNDWKIHFIYLDIPKDLHQKIIEKRAAEMFDHGLVDEVKDILRRGFLGTEKPLKSIGYKETMDYIKDKFESKEAYLERLAINTRQLAKAQRTWFKKIERKEYNILSDEQLLFQDLNFFLQEN